LQAATNTIPVYHCTRSSISVKLDEYMIGPVKVIIGLMNMKPIYCIDEPSLTPKDYDVVRKLTDIIVSVGYDTLPSGEELVKLCRRYKLPYQYISEKFIELQYFIEREISGYGPLYPLIRDVNVEEIAVDGPSRPVSIFHRRYPFGWLDTNIVLPASEVDRLVLVLARRAGRSLSIAHPYAEGLLPEGHRLAATYAREVSRFGSSLVIRKHLEEPISIVSLIRDRVLSTLTAAYLWLLLDFKAAMIIAGPAASGKTTLLQALLGLIPSLERIVTIEDTPELNLSHHPRWDSLVTRYSYARGGEDIDLYKLAKFALRRRADYIVIGEVRGEEARILLHAAASGHGALATFHADTAESAIMRLKAPPISIGDSFIPLISAIVIVKRLRRGLVGEEVRRVSEIVEIIEESRGRWSLHRVITWNPRKDDHEPSDPRELVKNSYRLRRMAMAYGLAEEWIVHELEKRVRLLEDMLSRQLTDYSEVARRIDELAANMLIAALSKKVMKHAETEK